MPRIPRLYLVEARWPNGEVETRRYQTPGAAAERKRRFELGRPATFADQAKIDAWKAAHPGEELPTERPTVTVTPSHRVTWPHSSGDEATFDIPDAEMLVDSWYGFLTRTGVKADRVLRIDVTERGLAIEYRPNPPHGQRDTDAIEPKTWHVELT